MKRQQASPGAAPRRRQRHARRIPQGLRYVGRLGLVVLATPRLARGSRVERIVMWQT